MYERVTKPHYFRIALDIAARIARGELEEERKLYGRSVMASEYDESPKTIRAVILCGTFIYELIGPGDSKWTLSKAGEIKSTY